MARNKATADAAVYVHPDALEPDPQNPRRNDDAVPQVADSIRRFGFGAPIVARRTGPGRGVIIAGHTRWKAAHVLGLDRVPVRFMDLSEADARALMLADNKLAEIAEWDDDMLREVISELGSQEFDLSGLGWPDEELAELLADPLNPDTSASQGSDDVPEVANGEPNSTPGTVYILGPHRLLCGDSTQAESWDAVMQGDRAQMVWTDPPYGVAYTSGTRDPRDKKNYGKGDSLQNDDLDEDALRGLLDASLGSAMAKCKPGAAWYVAAPPGPLHLVFGEVLKRFGIWRRTLVWVKDQFVFGRGDYHYRHEPIFYGWTPGAAHYFTDDRTQDSILECPNPKRGGKGRGEHPTMKPVDLVRRCIRNSSRPGWIVVDPFGGSGTTLIASAEEGRVARLIELDPKFCDVIRRRWTAWAIANGRDPGPGALHEA